MQNPQPESAEEVNYNKGHRQRLKDKFFKSDPKHFADYELLELLLFNVLPRRDVKPLAKDLIARFGGFKHLINVDQDFITKKAGVSPNIYLQFKIIKEITNRILAEEVVDKHIISSWSALLHYLQFNMGNLKTEQFRVLFLNKKNILIKDEIIAEGTVDQTPVYPREIMKKAIIYDASSIVLVHNHPSGNVNPSAADIDITINIVNACKTISISVHDHVIVGGGNYYSFKSNLLL